MYNFSQFAEVAVEEIAENVEVAAIISLGQEDAEIPHPFPFPTHYRSDIEIGLKQGEMSSLAFTKFMTKIANVMFLYKRYPLKTDYKSVAEQVVAKYPFMISPLQDTVRYSMLKQQS